MKKTGWAFIVALTIALLTGLSPPASAAAALTGETGSTDAAAATWRVRNTGTVGVGAIQVWLGRGLIYRQGYYDAVIPGGQYSGWSSTEGFYVGPGYCLRVRFWANASGTELTDPLIYGPEQWGPFGATYGIDIRALPLGNPLCQHASPRAGDRILDSAP